MNTRYWLFGNFCKKMILWNLGEKLCRVKIICYCFCQNHNELQRRSTSNNNATQSDSKWKFGCLIKRALSVYWWRARCLAHAWGGALTRRARALIRVQLYLTNMQNTTRIEMTFFPFKLGQYTTKIRFTMLKCKDILLITNFFQ